MSKSKFFQRTMESEKEQPIQSKDLEEIPEASELREQTRSLIPYVKKQEILEEMAKAKERRKFNCFIETRRIRAELKEELEQKGFEVNEFIDYIAISWKE